MADEKGTAVQSQESALDSQGHEPFDVPGNPKLPACPTCKVGVLYTIAYDPEATHEVGQASRGADATSHDHYQASGGSVRLKCFNCDMTRTEALNPGAS